MDITIENVDFKLDLLTSAAACDTLLSEANFDQKVFAKVIMDSGIGEDRAQRTLASRNKRRTEYQEKIIGYDAIMSGADPESAAYQKAEAQKQAAEAQLKLLDIASNQVDEETDIIEDHLETLKAELMTAFLNQFITSVEAQKATIEAG